MEDSELKKEIIFSEKYLSSKVSEREFVHISENAKPLKQRKIDAIRALLEKNENYVYEFESQDYKFREKLISEIWRYGLLSSISLGFGVYTGYFSKKRLEYTLHRSFLMGLGMSSIPLCIIGVMGYRTKAEAEDYVFNRFIKN